MHQKSPGSSGLSVVSKDETFTAAAARVRQLIANARRKTALDQAKEVHKPYRSAASEALLIDAYAERIQDLIRQNLAAEASSLLSRP